MYRLTTIEANKLAASIEISGNRDEGYKLIDDFAKEKGVFRDDTESCFVLGFPDAQIFDAIRFVSN